MNCNSRKCVLTRSNAQKQPILVTEANEEVIIQEEEDETLTAVEVENNNNGIIIGNNRNKSTMVQTTIQGTTDLMKSDDDNDDTNNDNNEDTSTTITTTIQFSSINLLRLFLGLYESTRIYDTILFLTARDLAVIRCVSRQIRDELKFIEYTNCRNGKDYIVPYPGFPGLLVNRRLSTVSTTTRINDCRSDTTWCDGLFPHQLASLHAMYRAEMSCTDFGSLRGGILADAPGLGKTITALAITVSTAGTRVQTPIEFWDTNNITTGWNALRSNPAMTNNINKSLKEIRSWVEANYKKKSTLFMEYKRIIRYIEPPYNDDRLATINEFEQYVKQQMRSIGIPNQLLEFFRNSIVDIKLSLDKNNRKILQSRNNVDIDDLNRLLFERRLASTSATLIIVPDPLLEHWTQQISTHLNLSYLSDGSYNNNDDNDIYGIVYIDGLGDISNWITDNNYNDDNEDHVIALQTAVNTSSEKLKANLPPVWDLMQYTIVVTTFSRCKQEFETESMYGNLMTSFHSNNDNNTSTAIGKQSRKRRRSMINLNSNNNNNNNTTSPTKSFISTLLRMRWLRLIVDEGHELGGMTSASTVTEQKQHNLTQFINQIAAERRWVISGTPTTGNEDDPDFKSNALDQIQRLLYFIRHPKYGRNVHPVLATSRQINHTFQSINTTTVHENEPTLAVSEQTVESAWEQNVKRPFLNSEERGRDELLTILQQTMIMHQKDDINLPRPKFKMGEYQVPISEAKDQEFVKMYKEAKLIGDGLVENSTSRQRDGIIVRKALIDKFIDYLHSPEYQSVVDQAQAEYVIRVVRQERANLVDRKRNARRLQIISPSSSSSSNRRLSFDPNEESIDLRPIKVVIYTHVINNLLSVGELILRQTDNEHVAEMYAFQSIAEQSFELNRFRTGEKEFRTCPICHRENTCFNQSSSKGHRFGTICQNMLLEVVLQSDPEQRFLIEQERITRPINVSEQRMQGEQLEKYSVHSKFWQVDDILLVDVRDPHPIHVKRASHDEWDVWGYETCIELAQGERFEGKDWYFGPLPSSLDSNEDYLVPVVLKKWQPCGLFHNRSRWYTGPTLAEQPIQRVKQDVHTLLLDARLAHGLDLSFVTHIFLLDPIDDAALLEQITSRAYRIGATGSVTVETVNIFYETSSELDIALKDREKIFHEVVSSDSVSINDDDDHDNNHNERMSVIQDVAKTSTRQVCDYCFRSFDTLAEAETHEWTSCPRNPKNISTVDPFSFASVFRALRPPPAIEQVQQSSEVRS